MVNTSLAKIKIPAQGLYLSLCLGLVLLLSACQPPPRPFATAHKGDFSATQLGPRAGLIVAPVTGDIPKRVGVALAEAMAAALRRREVTAGTAPGHRRSHHLRGEAIRLSDQRLAMTWRLFTPEDGETLTVAQEAEISAQAWQRGEAGLLARLASKGADAVDHQLRRRERGQGRRIALAPVTMGPVDGVPGLGGRKLAAAMATALADAGVPLADEPSDDGFILLGSMYFRPSGSGLRPEIRIEMVWHLIRPDGREFGKVAQANTVPKGQLTGDWRHLARAIARAGAPGVRNLLLRDPG